MVRSKFVFVRRAIAACLVLASALAAWLVGRPLLFAEVAPVAPAADAPIGTPLGPGHLLGEAIAVDNLTVFPVYAKSPVDLGEFTTLERAIASREAEVRELGGEAGAALVGDAPSQARVDTLVVENKGKRSILVLAGTVVKGGKQDRQIAEDFVVAPGKTVDVAAFCVEQGRWNGTRDGQATGGRFVAHKTLALSDVRAAGAYEKDQSKVWAEVGKANAAHAKDAPSSTLMASLDDPELTQRRGAMAGQATRALAAVKHPTQLVGVAYAVDGEVLGLRWFAGPKLFDLYRDALLETAAFEAITAQARAKAAGEQVKKTAAKASDVSAFVTRMENEGVAERTERKGQVGAKKKTDAGYASELVLQPASASPGQPAPVTKDFLKRKASVGTSEPSPLPQQRRHPPKK
jgi:hypothetical protein